MLAEFDHSVLGSVLLMKSIVKVIKIDEEKLKAAKKREGDRPRYEKNTYEIIYQIHKSMHIFNLDYNPEKEGWRTCEFSIPTENINLFKQVASEFGELQVIKRDAHY